MSAASNYLENKVLGHVLGGVPYTAPTTLYLALFTGTVATTLANIEVGTLTNEISTSGTGYGRKTITFGTASNGAITNNNTAIFDPATSAWGTLTCVAIMDAATGGNVLLAGPLTISKTIDSGDGFQMASGNLTISLT